MPDLNSKNAVVAITGAIYVAPAATAAPTDGQAALPVDWQHLGYVTEDGVTETRDQSSDTLRAWQNADVLRTVITEAALTFQFVLAETKPETVGLYYGTTVDAATGSVIIVPGSTGGRQSFVIDVVDGDTHIRAYVPEGEVTEVGDQVLSHGEVVGYDVTVTAYPSATLVDSVTGQNGAARKWYSAFSGGAVVRATEPERVTVPADDEAAA